MATPPPQNQIGSWVRNYVHYDNIANTYSKQASASRKLRDEFEDKIIQNLRSNNMLNAVIQVSGARLQYTEEKTVPTLSMPRLELYLHAYFKQKGNGIDETESILRYIKTQKMNDTQVTAKLKKTSIPPAIPSAPGSQSLQ
jgi:hypothetical protein